MPPKDLLRRKSKRKQQKPDETEEPEQTPVVVSALVSDVERTEQAESLFQLSDDELVPTMKKKPEKLVKPSWRDRIRESLQRSSGSADVAQCASGNTDGQQPSTSYQVSGITFTRDVSPPEALQFQRLIKQRRMLLQAVLARRRELEEMRAAEPDPPFSFSFVRDTLLKYERVDDWLKEVHYGYLKLARWKKPYHTGGFLAVVLGCTWIGFLLHLLLYTALLYVFGQSFRECIRRSDDGKVGKHTYGRFKLKVDDVPRMMKLNMRVSKTFQEISTAFDKTQSLLSWKKPRTTLCLLLALLALLVLAFWQGQAFAVQVTVTLILLKLFVADYLCRLFPEAAKYDVISRAWDQLPVSPVESSERCKSRG